MIDISKLVKKSHELALEKGWWEGKTKGDVDTILAKIALIHTELSEAWECFRKGSRWLWYAESGKPEGRVVELADAAIRAADLLGWLGDGWGDGSAAYPVSHGDSAADLEDIRAWLDSATESVRDGDTAGAAARLVSVVRGINDMADEFGLSGQETLTEAIEIKHAYNATRTHRHGGRLA